MDQSKIFESLIYGLNGLISVKNYPGEKRLIFDDKKRAEEFSHLILSIKPDDRANTMRGHIYGPFYYPLERNDVYEVTI